MRIRLTLTWKRLAGVALMGVAGALFISYAGIVSIAASSGHWGVTSWFLGWTMTNAVRTQALLVEKPEGLDLDDPALVRRAAGHYATGCAACHAAPGVPQSPVVQEMVPSPPRLEEKIAEWGDEELFWIVKNGIKFSEMPAWPTQSRDDEVWAQVAFLRALPDMTRADYAEMALGGGAGEVDPEAGGETTAALDGVVSEALADCARCHGDNGLGANGVEGAFPIIAGQPAPYLYETLRAFAIGQRESGFMEPPAHRYSSEVLAWLARHYAARPGPGAGPEPLAPLAGPPRTGGQDAAGILEGEGELPYGHVPPTAGKGPPSMPEGLRDLGRRIALQGISAQKLPACQSCHGQAAQVKNPFFPYLGGQPEWYLAEHLRLWRDGARGGTRLAHVMDEIARGMTDEQIAAVSAWYADLPTARP